MLGLNAMKELGILHKALLIGHNLKLLHILCTVS